MVCVCIYVCVCLCVYIVSGSKMLHRIVPPEVQGSRLLYSMYQHSKELGN